jgi:IS30 family transposase
MIAQLKRRSDRREAADQVLRRADWLDSADRALLEQVLDRGVSTRTIATVSGVSSRTIQRRVARLVRRLADPDVLAVLRCHKQWPAIDAAVALSVIVRGRTMRRAGRDLGLTLHEVRKHLHQARGLIDASRPERRASR